MTRNFLLSPSQEAVARHDICVVFADVVGSTRLALSLPLEQFGELMPELLQLMTLVCEGRGGEVLPHQGDAVLSLWRKSEVAYALESAAELHGRVANLRLATRLGLDLKLRVGVACGEAIVGVVGGNPSAFGAPMSLARRLCDAAHPEQTLVCGETCRVSEGAVMLPLDLDALPDFPSVRVSALIKSPSLSHMKIS